MPSLEVEVSKNMLIDMYKKMNLMRRMEMAADALYRAKLIRGFCHLAIGQVILFFRLFSLERPPKYQEKQEAVSVGMNHAITWDDLIITSYRCHPFAVLRGGSVKGVIAELLGRQDGMSNGKGGSMHIFTPRFFGGNGIVGAQVPLGTGISLAMQYLDRKAATFTMYGDGAANQGQVFESFNMVSSLFYQSLIALTFRTSFHYSGEALEPSLHLRL